MPKLLRGGGSIIRYKLDELEEKGSIYFSKFKEIWKRGYLTESQMVLLINTELYEKSQTKEICSQYVEEEMKKIKNEEIKNFSQYNGENMTQGVDCPETPYNTQQIDGSQNYLDFSFSKKKNVFRKMNFFE